MEKNNKEKTSKILDSVIPLLIGLWLVIPALFYFSNSAPNSIDFWINCGSLLLGIITIISGLKSFKNM